MDYYRQESMIFRFNGGITPAVKALLWANGIVFLLEFILPDAFLNIFVLSLGGIRQGMIWQFFTYMFLHSTGNFMHILFNMLILFMIGPETERGLGSRLFFIVYVTSGLVGGLMWILLGYQQPCIGASGAVYGVLGAFAALWPNRQLTLLIFFVLPVTLRAWMLVGGLALLAFLYSVAGPADQIAHATHLVGVAVGVGLTYWFVHGNGASFFSRKPRLRVLKGGHWSGRITRRPEPEEPDVDSRTIDVILDKIARDGMGSLSRRERALLEAASRQRKNRS